MYFSFSVIFSFLAIFQVLHCAFSFFSFFSDFFIFQVKWMFLIFHDFQFSCHIPGPTVDISKFSTFLFFLAIFHVLKCVFLIFRDFQFSRHITGPSLCISHFHVFQWFLHFSSRQVDVLHFPWFSVFLPYSTSYSGHF